MTEWIRPKEGTALPPQDVELIKREVEKLGAIWDDSANEGKGWYRKLRILEFGPGDSTELFLSLGCEVTTCEHMDKWFDVAKERFGDKVRLLKFDDEVPVIVHGLGEDERFDLAFVDTPQGFKQARKIHKGYEDCSRFNTALFALQRAPVVLLHDTSRPLEKGTLGKLCGMGYDFDQLKSNWGMARITNDSNENGPHLPDATQSGSVAAGSDAERGGVSVDL